MLMNDYVMQKSADAPRRPQRELTGRTVFLCLLAFFAVVTSVNAYMMSVAIRTMPGVDVKSAYEASQTYNAEIARAQAQNARGWSADVSLGAKESERDVVIRLTDKAGAPVQGLAIEARLAHPADRKADIASRAQEIAPGVYSARFALAHTGAWDLVIEGRDTGGEVYKSRSRVKL
jgi:nitrogen fixation protein FixH